MSYAHPLDDPDYSAMERARDNITTDKREYEEFAARLLAEHHDTLAELVSGAYGYGEQAINRFRRLLDDCRASLDQQAQRNLETRRF